MSSPEDAQTPASLRHRLAELERSAERFRTILEHAPVMIDSFDENGRCTLWNRECERTLGWSREEIETCADPLSLTYPDPAERDRVLATIARADGTFREYRVRAKDGSMRVQLWADFKLPTGELISVGHDITDQRAMEERLRQAQKLEAVGRLTGGLAHDFNNLLTVILGNLELIEVGLETGAEGLPQLVAEVRAAAGRGARLIRKLLTFSRRTALEIRPLDLAPVVEAVSQTLRRLLPESIEVAVTAERDLPRVEADPDAVEQILMNLATNSWDAMPKGGTLSIGLTRRHVTREQARNHEGLEPGEFVTLEVSDSGSGMSPETLEKALEPFFTTKSVEKGSGLGLAIVYGLMEQHHGAIDIGSEPGVGTTVAVHFPVARRSGADAGPGAVEAESRGGTETLLIAEDEASIRELARVALEQAGYSVLLAADGREALEQLERHGSRIALVITDLVMPKMSGSDLERAARRVAPQVRFLVTTGYGETDVPAPSGLLSAAKPLRKPWTLSELLARVRGVLDE